MRIRVCFFGNKRFGTSSPFSFVQKFVSNTFSLGSAWTGLVFFSWLKLCQKILNTCIDMFSFVIVTVASCTLPLALNTTLGKRQKWPSSYQKTSENKLPLKLKVLIRAKLSELEWFSWYSWCTHYAWNSHTAVYFSLCTPVHGQTCRWLILDKPIFWPMRGPVI